MLAVLTLNHLREKCFLRWCLAQRLHRLKRPPLLSTNACEYDALLCCFVCLFVKNAGARTNCRTFHWLFVLCFLRMWSADATDLCISSRICPKFPMNFAVNLCVLCISCLDERVYHACWTATQSESLQSCTQSGMRTTQHNSPAPHTHAAPHTTDTTDTTHHMNVVVSTMHTRITRCVYCCASRSTLLRFVFFI